MDEISVKVAALIAGGTTSAVGILKKLFPTWITGKEEALSQLFPVIFIVIAKLAGGFKNTEWVDAMLFAVGGGIGANVIHDKLVNPLMKGLKKD
jgi:hypothetical protein